MAFDLSTAKPVSGGFDINTAKPVNAPPEVVYREETDTPISAPAGLRGNEFEYLDNVQNRAKKPSDHFGFVDVGNATLSALEYPAALFKGSVNAVINADKNMGAGYIRQIAEAKKEVFENKPLSEMTNAEKLDKIRRDNTPALATFLFGSERDKQLQTGWLQRLFTPKEQGLAKAEGLRQKSIQIQQDTDRFLKKANLTRPDGAPGFIFDVGSIGTTVGTSIGLSVATKNPLAAATLFRDMQKNSIYLEAQEKGWNNIDADKVSAYAANFEGALEFMGVNYFLKAAEMSKPIARIGFRMFEEAIQEGTQTGAEEAITQISALRDVDIEGAGKRVFYSMLLGAIGGGGTAAVMEIGDHVGKQEGVPKVVTDKLAEKIEANMPEIESHLESLIGEQASPLRADEESAGKVAKMMQDFNDGKEIDVSSLSEDEQARLREMGLVPKDQIRVDHSLHLPEDFRNFSVTYPSTMQGAEDAARDYVLKRGGELGNEHVIVMDGNTGTALHHAEGVPNQVTVPGEFAKEFNNPNNKIIIHHNHPSETPLSTSDIANLAWAGKKATVAHTGAGESRASLTEKFKSLLDGKDRKKVYAHIEQSHRSAWKAAVDILVPLWKSGQLSAKDVNIAVPEIANRAMANAGAIDYATAHDITGIPEALILEAQTKADGAAKEKLLRYGYNTGGAYGRISDSRQSMAGKENKGVGNTRQSSGNMAPKPGRQGVGAKGKEGATGGSGDGRNPPPDSGGIAEDGEPERDTEADYEAVRTAAKKRGFFSGVVDTLKAARDVTRDGGSVAADLFIPVSTRLDKMNPKLKHAVRRFVFQTGLYTTEDQAAVKPFIEKVSNLSPEDYAELDLALKNRDQERIESIFDEHDLHEDWIAVRKVLDDLYADAKDVGLDMSYIPDYFPRKVKRNKVGEYMAWIRGQDEWSQIQLALNEIDPDGTFDQEERAEFVNNFLRGFSSNKINLSKTGMTKKRTVDYVTAEANEFYQDSMPTLIDYVSNLNHAIESRKLFGKSEAETDKNIGAYVDALIQEGSITPEQENDLKRILKAVVEPKGTGQFFSWAKNYTYIYLMGSPASALTQIQDLAFSIYQNGPIQTGKSFLKSVTGNASVTKEDIGIEHMLQEFQDPSRSSEAVRKVFRNVGLSWMDNIGKETLMDGALANLKKAAIEDSVELNEKLDLIFGNEADTVKKDLADGVISENVKYLLFSELSDFQPISLAEQPLGYLRGGNGRVFYMLKTYTIKQFDIYRREIFDKMGRTSVKENAEGLRNLIALATALMLMGMGRDKLTDLLFGREVEIDDLVMNNILKLTGFTKYQIYKAKDDGVMNSFFMTMVVPPIGAPFDDLGKDIAKIGFGDKELKDSEVLGKTPYGGKFYYWWWGGGRTKLESKEGDAGKF